MNADEFKQIFPLGEKNEAYAKFFVGQSYLNMLTTEGVGIANVTFEPGCRNNWHIHHKGGQILLCTAGRGYYQEWGKPVQEMKPGDVINIPPEVKHWHGAAPDSWFSHLAVEVPAEGGSNEWLEPVEDETYQSLKKFRIENRSVSRMEKKMLIVYYSVSNGNTKRIAEQLQKATGADIAQIETETPYTGSYNDIVEQGQREVNRGYQPKIKPLSLNPMDYDVIAIGTPTWWYTMAPAVLSFLKSYDWTGKTVIPFQTHGGWPGHVIKDIKSVCKGANFSHEMEIQFDSTGGAELVTSDKKIETWIEQIRGEN